MINLTHCHLPNLMDGLALSWVLLESYHLQITIIGFFNKKVKYSLKKIINFFLERNGLFKGVHITRNESSSGAWLGFNSTHPVKSSKLKLCNATEIQSRGPSRGPWSWCDSHKIWLRVSLAALHFQGHFLLCNFLLKTESSPSSHPSRFFRVSQLQVFSTFPQTEFSKSQLFLLFGVSFPVSGIQFFPLWGFLISNRLLELESCVCDFSWAAIDGFLEKENFWELSFEFFSFFGFVWSVGS